MVDVVDAERNLASFRKNRECLLAYNHLYSSFAFKNSCFAEVKELDRRIANIEEQLYAKSKKTRSSYK